MERVSTKTKFLTQPNKDPKTGKSIKIGGKEYKHMEEKYGTPKIKSPKTQKKISVNKGEYKKLIKEGYTENQLLYGNEIKNVITDKQSITPNLQSITSLNIDYLSHLNYVDLKNLSVSNTSFKNILSDLSLKTILFNKLNIQVKENVSDLMKELDAQIDALLNIHYVEFPRWINKELFLHDQKARLYKKLPHSFYTKLDDDHIYKTETFDEDMYESDMSLSIELGREFLAFPFISNEYEVPDYDDEIPIHHSSLNLSKQFVDYLMNNMGKFIHWRNMEKRLEILFFTDN